MKILTAIMIALWASAPVHAHSGEEHGASAQTEGGHAAALGQPGDAAQVTRTVRVSMSDAMRFAPARIEVRQGETIRFRVENRGRLRHEMVLGTLAELKAHAELMARFPHMEHDDPNAVTVEPGQTGELIWQFTHPGTFHFACLVPGHFEAGMRGAIIVRANEPASSRRKS